MPHSKKWKFGLHETNLKSIISRRFGTGILFLSFLFSVNQPRGGWSVVIIWANMILPLDVGNENENGFIGWGSKRTLVLLLCIGWGEFNNNKIDLLFTFGWRVLNVQLTDCSFIVYNLNDKLIVQENCVSCLTIHVTVSFNKTRLYIVPNWNTLLLLNTNYL